jgi:putative ABC transport system permease protein
MRGMSPTRVESTEQSRLRLADVWPLAALGMGSRPLRAILSALGIAIGIATIVAVLGISTASRGQLVAQIDALGTNLLTVTAGQSLSGQTQTLPAAAPSMIARIGPVQSDSAIGDTGANIYRSDRIPAANTNALSVYATGTRLLNTVQGHLNRGRFLNAATEHLPAVVLGSDAAATLGVDHADGSTQLWLADHWFAVTGILDPLPLAPELDRAALIGFPIAKHLLHAAGHPVEIYVRTDPTSVGAVQSVLAATADPAAPQSVTITNPSDALSARADATAAFHSLYLALGAVALLVGGIGIANVMIIAVLERRGEIGLRRALGATPIHVGAQFVAEASLLSLTGGGAGALIGTLATSLYATARSWPAATPVQDPLAAIALAVVLGAVAGLYPATKAARLSPAEALRTV